MSKVTIILPVYNSVQRAAPYNFLEQMISSILKQTYTDIELLIIDNQSEDNTVAECTRLTNRDHRVRILIDDQKRSYEDVQSRMLDIMTGDYVMSVSDDDIINHNYIQTLISKMIENPNIDMAYSNGAYVTATNQIAGRLIATSDGVYTPYQPYHESFYKAIHRRIVLPVLFGIFRKEVWASLMPHHPFDELRANMDNLFMAKFFLNRHKAFFFNYDMFFYRKRDRHLDPNDLDYMPNNPILIWVYYVRHQLYFYGAVHQVIEQTNHGERTESLKMMTLDSCLNQCVNLLNWVGRDLVNNAFERSIIQEIFNQYKPINDLRLPPILEPIKKIQNIMRLRCKILDERVLNYLKIVVQDIGLITDTQHEVRKIKTDIISKLNA